MAITILIACTRWVAYVRRDQVVPPYKMTLLWVDYGDGFVRRGLPGQLLSIVTGGTPTFAGATIFGVALSAVGAAALLTLAITLAAMSNDRAGVLVLLACSPLALPLIVRDLGRYDALVVAALTLSAVILRSHWRWKWFAVAALLATASAVQEFAVVLAVPLVVVALRAEAGRSITRAVGSVLPALIVAATALALRPDRGWLFGRVNAAVAAGVRSSNGDDAASVLAATPSEQWATFGRYSLQELLGLSVLLLALTLLTCWAIWRTLGRPDPKVARLTLGWLFTTAGTLSLIGVDFLRWWSLALTGFLCVLLLIASKQATPKLEARVERPWLLPLVVGTSLLLADLPIEPPRWG